MILDDLEARANELFDDELGDRMSKKYDSARMTIRQTMILDELEAKARKLANGHAETLHSVVADLIAFLHAEFPDEESREHEACDAQVARLCRENREMEKLLDQLRESIKCCSGSCSFDGGKPAE